MNKMKCLKEVEEPQGNKTKAREEPKSLGLCIKKGKKAHSGACLDLLFRFQFSLLRVIGKL